MRGDQAPCSFMNNIFINPEKYDWNTYNQILEHEKVHVKEKHSLDILFAEMVLIFQWFNPFAWVYRKEIENNLEFLTDDKVLQSGNLEICSYSDEFIESFSRPSAAQSHHQLIINHYSKKRIAMMNAKNQTGTPPGNISSWYPCSHSLPAYSMSL
jgi:beta-lactamase regulating signal transducer with metallopeptidase domain